MPLTTAVTLSGHPFLNAAETTTSAQKRPTKQRLTFSPATEKGCR